LYAVEPVLEATKSPSQLKVVANASFMNTSSLITFGVLLSTMTSLREK
jgi:hypothetical protein